ncbi:hypothetical protein ACZ87_03698 [Candidatus Erwinia dacicola]|uniref:Uncharacterized protein n=1 Tax=Candidatus Erwinia dacicola TaxID=252393 RepID=A0A328TJN2_9GAMM|nr:hypothetical protein ACZ87_03698 [Candidatus Erwinia dacicola]
MALPPEKAQSSRARVLSDNRRKGRVAQAETREAADVANGCFAGKGH